MFRLKRRTIMLISLIGVISLIIGFSTFISLATEDPDKQPSYSITKPPQSMDQYYPPKSESPVYLLQMFELEGAFSGIMATMGAELTKEKPNPAQIGELSGQLGMVSCRGCHLVHMPAAMVQEAWKE